MPSDPGILDCKAVSRDMGTGFPLCRTVPAPLWRPFPQPPCIFKVLSSTALRAPTGPVFSLSPSPLARNRTDHSGTGNFPFECYRQAAHPGTATTGLPGASTRADAFPGRTAAGTGVGEQHHVHPTGKDTLEADAWTYPRHLLLARRLWPLLTPLLPLPATR